MDNLIKHKSDKRESGKAATAVGVYTVDFKPQCNYQKRTEHNTR